MSSYDEISSVLSPPFRIRFLPLTTSNNYNNDNNDGTNGHRYLIITNISKKPNIKALICTAAAHDFIPLLIAEPNITESDCSMAKPSRSVTTTASSQQSTVDDVVNDNGSVSEMARMEEDLVCNETACQFIDVLRCESIEKSIQFMASKHVTIVGIEIMDNAESIMAVDTFAMLSRIAFFPGNEGTGLSEHHKACCQKFVYIPHYGCGGTGSLNVSVAATIVMNQYVMNTLHAIDHDQLKFSAYMLRNGSDEEGRARLG